MKQWVKQRAQVQVERQMVEDSGGGEICKGSIHTLEDDTKGTFTNFLSKAVIIADNAVGGDGLRRV